MDLGLTDKVAVVTGGSEGIGRAVAHRLSAEGAKVSICARRPDVLEQAAQSIRDETGGDVLAVPADVTVVEDLERFVNQTVGAFGTIDILINNAGRAAHGHFEKTTDEDWQADFDLKVFAAVRMARLVIPHMRRAGGGRIINVTHPGGKAPGADSMPTSVARAAGIALTKALSRDYVAENILVNTVCLTNIHTAQIERAWKNQGSPGTLDEFCDRFAERVPLGRLGQPAEAADLVAFLVSERAAFITGTSINIDGGMSAVV